jgi:hypothetical protein
MIQTCANGTGPVRQTAVPQTGHAVSPRCGVAFAKTGEGRAGEGHRGRVGFQGGVGWGRGGARWPRIATLRAAALAMC